jgi:aspartyl-tRNA(Asn)/glutamyl-tRNA(Gln) amidotransferase subunit A
LAKTPGGSSGGAAVALAVGVGPLATGGDGAGSIRVPCSFTGVFGLKTSYALVPAFPSSLGALSVAGPMSRTVYDAALMLDVISQPDVRDPYTVPKPCVSFRDDLDKGIKGLRVAYSEDLGFGLRDADVLDNFRRSLDVLKDLGAEIEPVRLDLSLAREHITVIWAAGMAGDTFRLSDDELGLLDPPLASLLVKSKDLSANRLQRAWKFVDELAARCKALHSRFDALVTPTTPIPAFDAGTMKPDGLGLEDWFDWTPLTWPFNLTRQPAASSPNGFTPTGLPTGLQVIGKQYDDALVLRICAAFEAATQQPNWSAEHHQSHHA